MGGPGKFAQWRRLKGPRAHFGAAGLLRQSRPGLASNELLGAELSPSARLRVALDELGPLFSAFGDYLALRADLLPQADCHDLTRSPGLENTEPLHQVRQLLRAELGKASAPLCSSLQSAHRANHMAQRHNALAADGSRLDIKILRPGFEHSYREDNDLLQALKAIRLPVRDGGLVDIASALPGFLHHQRGRLDLTTESADLVRLADTHKEFGGFSVATPIVQLCTSRVLTQSATDHTYPLNTPPEQDTDGVDPARRLALLWLQQALLEPLYPQHPIAEMLSWTRDRELSIQGGACGRLHGYLRHQLLHYLSTAARDDCDGACAALLTLCDATPKAQSRARMQALFRQAEPFRAGGWSRHFTGEVLANTLFVQWRLAHRNGYRLKPPVAAFCSGLFDLERQCRQLSPQRDTLRMGLDDVRIIAAAVRAREQLGPTQTRDNLYRLVERGSKMLRRNAVANRRREDETEAKKHYPPSKAPANHSLSSLGIFLIISAAALIASGLSTADSGLAGGDLMGTLLYTLTGLVLLAHTARGGTDV